MPQTLDPSPDLNSEAYSTSTGILHRLSIRYSPTRPACQDVPQAHIMMRRAGGHGIGQNVEGALL